MTYLQLFSCMDIDVHVDIDTDIGIDTDLAMSLRFPEIPLDPPNSYCSCILFRPETAR